MASENRARVLVPVGMTVMAATMALGFTACGGRARAPSSTTFGRSSGAPNAYPPVPRAAPGAPRGCLGRKAVGMTTAQTAHVRDAVLVLGGTSGRLLGLGACPGGPVVVMLAAGEEVLAHRLWAQYGSHVAISVGLTSYNGSPGRSPRCGVVPPSSPLPTGLHVALRLKSRTVRAGSFFDAYVVITETGPGTFFMDTGQPLEAVVVRSRTQRVVGVFDGGIGGTGYGGHLSHGQSETIPVIGGTARCDGGIGSALPPGTYQVIVRVAPETTPRSPAYLTPPVPLRVASN